MHVDDVILATPARTRTHVRTHALDRRRPAHVESLHEEEDRHLGDYDEEEAKIMMMDARDSDTPSYKDYST